MRCVSWSRRGFAPVPNGLNNSLPALECDHVFQRQREPFTLSTFISESPVPVRLHSDGVVGFDAVNSLRRNWNLNGQLAASTTNGVCASDFVMGTGLHEIYETRRNFTFAFPLFPRCPRRSILLLDAEREDVLESRGFSTMCGNRVKATWPFLQTG